MTDEIKFDKRSEIWRPIKGYENIYDVSNYGNVYSHRLKRNLKLSTDKLGYIRIGLQKTNRKDVRKFYVHRLVAEAFIPNKDDKSFINHKDENKKNNCVNNLEWCTHKENMNYGTRNKRIALANKNSIYLSKKIKCITTGEIFDSMNDAFRRTGVWRPNITKCCNGERKTAGGLKWQIL